jgi:hypothetical protein
MSEGERQQGADAMFKWVCLGVAVLFLGAVLWMVNDIRLQVRQSAQLIDSTGETIKADLPAIVERTRQTSEVVSKNLPGVMERVDTTTAVMAELADDIRQLKELAGLSHAARDKGVAAYGTSVLAAIEASGGEIGTKKTIGKGLKSPRPAADWVRGERREVLFLTVLGRSKKELFNAIVKTKLGFNWYIQLPGKDPVKLSDWLRENHEETKKL